MITAFISLLLISIMVQPGDQAPAFSAVSTDGSIISLSDFKGKSNVVLYFYPEDMTGGCTKQAQCFRDDMPKYKAANTVVLGVSLDDQEKHQRFTEKENLNFPLLVDKDGAICKAYGVPVNDKWPARWTFFIDKDGKIVKKYENVNPTTNSSDILKELETISQN
jgi:thioredoxin-dependent peroxiredoxin